MSSGLYDMLGNVWEWTETQITNPTPEQSGTRMTYAGWAPEDTPRVVRGGSFLSGDSSSSAARSAAGAILTAVDLRLRFSSCSAPFTLSEFLKQVPGLSPVLTFRKESKGLIRD